jgi:membrane protease YdiL (CAAX protease family)
MNNENEIPASQPEPETQLAPEAQAAANPVPLSTEPAETRFLKWALFGSQGLRAGWSVALFLVLTVLFLLCLGSAASAFVHHVLHTKTGQFTAISAMIGEIISVLAVLAAVAICARVEHRRILDYNLNGPRRTAHFATGLVGGFVALSILVGGLAWGGWLHFGGIALSGGQIAIYGALWGTTFLLTGLFEEGSARCYLQFTLTRGINFWWALGLIGAMCASGLIFQHGEGIWGIYIISALGLVPCFLLHTSKSSSAGFWQAAWVTSTFFGFIHTGNTGETWIGIFAAAAIGFVFCVSIWLTGSAWWAIGFHASWDWAETFFYGTADSGMQPQGHFLTTSPVGAALWSGGSDGPEGSLLVIFIILLTLLALIAIYGRRRPTLESTSTAVQPQLS